MKPSDYEFKIGDKVITTYGEVGHIVDICKCEMCIKRGFFEPTWMEDDASEKRYITLWDAEDEFNMFYQIGKYRFNNVFNKLAISLHIDELEETLNKRKKQLRVIEEFQTEVNTPSGTKEPRCHKCVYEMLCSRDKDDDHRCIAYKRDVPDGGYYG